LVQAAPKRPGEERIEGDAGGKLEAADETADLIRAESDHKSRLPRPFLPRAVAAALSVTCMAAKKASASIARVMWRYQPCRERIS
jgi:hypothetical protein